MHVLSPMQQLQLQGRIALADSGFCTVHPHRRNGHVLQLTRGHILPDWGVLALRVRGAKNVQVEQKT